MFLEGRKRITGAEENIWNEERRSNKETEQIHKDGAS
jgi:hypothetical protein